jgi:hypothetical protein
VILKGKEAEAIEQASAEEKKLPISEKSVRA